MTRLGVNKVNKSSAQCGRAQCKAEGGHIDIDSPAILSIY